MRKWEKRQTDTRRFTHSTHSFTHVHKMYGSPRSERNMHMRNTRALYTPAVSHTDTHTCLYRHTQTCMHAHVRTRTPVHTHTTEYFKQGAHTHTHTHTPDFRRRERCIHICMHAHTLSQKKQGQREAGSGWLLPLHCVATVNAVLRSARCLTAVLTRSLPQSIKFLC